MPPDDSRPHANHDPDRDARGRWLRAPPTAWKPGVCGGGRGRPAQERELAEAARRLTLETLAELASVMRDRKAQAIARVRAGEVILERAFGKAPQRIVLENETAGLDNAALQQFLRTALRDALATIEAEPVEAEMVALGAPGSGEAGAE